MDWSLFGAKLLDFLLFCLVFFSWMAVTLAVLYILLVACDWVEDEIKALWKKLEPKSRKTFGW